MVKYIIESSDKKIFQVDDAFVESSGLLRHFYKDGIVQTKDDEPVELQKISSNHLQLAIGIIGHYESESVEDDLNWSVQSLAHLDDEELCAFARDIDFIDSRRIVRAICYSIVDRGTNDVDRLRSLLGVQNDFSEAELASIEENPLMYFLGSNVVTAEPKND